MLVKKTSGQTLVILLVFMAVATIITSASIIMNIVNSVSTSQLSQGSNAFDIAESGAENGLLRLLRDPNYQGEILPVGSGITTVSVTGFGGPAPVLTSVGTIFGFSRVIQVKTSYTNNVLTILSWKELRGG